MSRVNDCRIKTSVSKIVGISSWAHQIRTDIARVAAHDSGVLITGPTGTGKELVARAIHEHSPRANGPFVAVDCAALPDDLFASHMFGHVKGAFTGAQCTTLGVFRAADRGTVFLDEIGELGLHLQAKLLRALQEKVVTPVGSHEALPFNARVVAATNRDLETEVHAGRFRRDLYYRLNIVSLRTVPLVERIEDVPILAQHFLGRLACEEGFPHKQLSADALALLIRHDWPGNVRELHHRLERAVIFTENEVIDTSAFPELLARGPDASCDHPRSCEASLSNDQANPMSPGQPPFSRVCCHSPDISAPTPSVDTGPWLSLAEVERRHIISTLEQAAYNQTTAARMLGIDRHALRRKIKKLGIFLGTTRRGRPPKR